MRIICFGDSNTFGYDPRDCSGGRYPAESRWVDLLAAKTGLWIRNRGENGRQIPDTPSKLAQVDRMLRANAPVDVFVVMLGTNDLLQGGPVLEITARMERFLQYIRPFCERVLLVAPPPMKYGSWVTEGSLLQASSQLGEAFGSLAARLGISFADAGAWNVELAFDGVHFTEEGHRTFAEGLIPFL